MSDIFDKIFGGDDCEPIEMLGKILPVYKRSPEFVRECGEEITFLEGGPWFHPGTDLPSLIDRLNSDIAEATAIPAHLLHVR